MKHKHYLVLDEKTREVIKKIGVPPRQELSELYSIEETDALVVSLDELSVEIGDIKLGDIVDTELELKENRDVNERHKYVFGNKIELGNEDLVVDEEVFWFDNELNEKEIKKLSNELNKELLNKEHIKQIKQKKDDYSERTKNKGFRRKTNPKRK